MKTKNDIGKELENRMADEAKGVVKVEEKEDEKKKEPTLQDKLKKKFKK